MKSQGRSSDLSDVSVVICHHTGDLILECLSSLPKGVDVVIATSQKGRTFNGYKTIHVQRNEPTYKRNVAVRYTTGRYIAFLDDDVILKHGCLEELKECLFIHKVGMSYATLLNAETKLNEHMGSFLTHFGFLYESHKLVHKILAGKSACCMIRKDLFNTLNGFDEEFVIYGEETDLSWRLWNIGYENRMTRATALHYHDTKKKDASFYNKRYIHFHGCKNYLTMLFKNLPCSRMYMLFINMMCWFFMGMAMLFRHPKAGLWILQGIGWFIKNSLRLRHKRMGRYNPVVMNELLKTPPLSYYTKRFCDYLTHQIHGGVS